METLLVSLATNIILPVLFGWIWKKKVTPLRQATEAVVTAVAAEGATAVAKKTKALVNKQPPAVKEALDGVIKAANALVKN